MRQFEFPPTFTPNNLRYEPLQEGRDYWVRENVLPDPWRTAERIWNRRDWIFGAPYKKEAWPGMRAPEGLNPEELALVECTVKSCVGVPALSSERDPQANDQLSHNFAQLVGGGDSSARPHVDALRYCNYAAVLYLHPYPPTKHSGTSFYRLKLPDGSLGGNLCPPPYHHLTDALGIRSMPITAWEEDVEVPNVFNRLLVYRANIVHSATSYFGAQHHEKRMTVVFFWKVPQLSDQSG